MGKDVVVLLLLVLVFMATESHLVQILCIASAVICITTLLVKTYTKHLKMKSCENENIEGGEA